MAYLRDLWRSFDQRTKSRYILTALVAVALILGVLITCL